MAGNKSLPYIQENTVPVNKLTARVAFFHGEHFEKAFPGNHFFLTMDTPPKKRIMPDDADDFTGLRHGRMTAFQYFRASRKGKKKAVVWVARCDCGKYEFRRPGMWDKHQSPETDPDRCEYCRRADTIGGNSKEKTDKRLSDWIRSMRMIGLSDDEIDLLRRSKITIKGLTKEQIIDLLKASAPNAELS